MALSLQEISDRLEIQDLIFEYSHLLDQKQFEQMRELFTEDAWIDYSAMGGSVGNLNDTIAFLKSAMVNFSDYQHLNANIQIKVDGDIATGRVMCFNPMEMSVDGELCSFMLGLWYDDTYVRTETGWRFKDRIEVKSWMLNEPEFMKGLRESA